MNLDLQRSLADNAKQWLALSLSISSAEKESFDATHDSLFASHGTNFMAHVYRTAFERMLQNLPDAERSKLLVAFGESIEEAVAKHMYLMPTAAQCVACHSRPL